MFSLSTEIIFEICLHIKDDSLNNFFQTCKKIYNINDEYFWKNKVCIKFGKSICDYKDKRESFKDQYKYLSKRNLTEISKLIFKRRIDVLEWSYINNVLPENASECNYKQNWKVVKWMKYRDIVPTHPYVLHHQILNNLKGLEYFHNNNLLDTIMWSASKRSGDKEIQYLLSKGYKFSENDLTDLSIRTDIIWEDLVDNRLTFKRSINLLFSMPSFVNNKFNPNALDRIESFFNQKVNLDDYKYYIFSKKNIDMVKYFYDNGVKFNKKCANYAAESGDIEILNYLDNIGIIPNKKGANYASRKDNIDVLDFLKERNIFPGKYGYINGSYRTKEWMKNNVKGIEEIINID